MILSLPVVMRGQDFSDLPGIDTVYFEDIRSIEFRVAVSSAGGDDTATLEDEVADVENQLKRANDPNRIRRLQDRLDELRRRLRQQYKAAASRDSWDSLYTTPLSHLPVYHLGTHQQIYFAFDDLNPEETRYAYTVVPYSWDWKEPLDLSESEYLTNYAYSEITDYLYSELTTTDYTAYRFRFPNGEMGVKYAGNYLLVVYELSSGAPAFTRRLYVTDDSFAFADDVRQPAYEVDSLQYINVSVEYPEDLVRLAPARDVKLVVLQNGRYDNAVVRERPSMVSFRQLRYGYQDPIVFQAFKQCRFVMMQTFRFAQVHTERLKHSDEGVEVYLTPDRLRAGAPSFDYHDLDGLYVTMHGIRNDEPGMADYAYVYFSLRADEPFDAADVYVVGKMTDWQFRPEYKLSYNPRARRYEGEVFLKQGYYDYYYALRRGGSPRLYMDETEGHYRGTDNTYQILVYHTEPTGRFQRLVAMKTIKFVP